MKEMNPAAPVSRKMNTSDSRILEPEYMGPRELLQTPARVLLISRNTSPPTPQAPWIKALVAAAEQAFRARELLITGAGRIAYDLPLFLCAKHKRPILVVTRESESPCIEPAAGSLHIRLPSAFSDTQRDAFVGSLAHAATQIAVRPGGTMAAVAAEIAARGGALDTWPLTQDDTVRPRWPRASLREFSPWDFITHFTREPDGAWPGEAYSSYLDYLCGGSNAPRDAFATLRRILSEQTLRGAGRLIRGGNPHVCATELPPHAVAALRGWRRGLRRWNFTPYAVAIRRQAALHLGFQPVRYDASAAKDPLVQIPRSGSYDWTLEREWRAAGDIPLAAIPRSDLLILTATEAEARAIQNEFGLDAAATG